MDVVVAGLAEILGGRWDFRLDGPGRMRPTFPMMSAATPETAGAAILVPAARQSRSLVATGPRQGAKTRSNAQQKETRNPVPGGVRGMPQKGLPGSTKSPPPAAKLTPDCP